MQHNHFPNLNDRHFAYLQPFSYYRSEESFAAARPEDLRRAERNFREDAVTEAIARSADLVAIGDAIHTRVVEPAFVLQDGYLKTAPVRIDGLGIDRPGDPTKPRRSCARSRNFRRRRTGFCPATGA